MTHPSPHTVVVGIDGSLAGSRALVWAADEAERRNAPLLVAHAGHVLQSDAISESTARSVLTDLCAFGEELLQEAVASVLENSPAVEVRTLLSSDHPAELLIDLSRSASVVVVGRAAEPALQRFVFGSVTKHLADRAHCPVVVVPAEPTTADGRVVVGVSQSPSGLRAFDIACTEATLRGTHVLAVRSAAEFPWAMNSSYQPGGVSMDSAESAQRAVLEHCVARAHERHPGVKIETELTFVPAESYLGAAADAALVVVGCRRTGSEHLPRLGPLTSWLLQHTDSPVMVVGQETTDAPSTIKEEGASS